MRASPDTVRAAAIAEARSWIGTPYLHQQAVKGAGCDCLGLVRGVWRALYGLPEPELPPPYSPDWAERHGRETLLEAAGRHLHPVAAAASLPGDVLVYRMRAGSPAKHAAILVEGTPARGRIVHAYAGHAVAETATLGYPLGGAFRFPPAAPGRGRGTP